MSRPRIILSIFVVMSCAVCAVAQSYIVSDGLNRMNAEVDIAFDPLSGNALVVWCQRSFDKLNDGAILAAYVLRYPTGELEITEPFRISPEGENHQRPQVAYLNASNGFLIVWDSASADLSEFRASEESLEQSRRTFARVFLPPGVRGASEVRGSLSDIVDFLPIDDTRSYARPRLVALPEPENAEVSTNEMLIFGVASDTTGERPYSAWTARLSIDVNGFITTIEDSELSTDNVWAIDGGFVHDGFVYAVGSSGDDEQSLHTGLFLLDAEFFTVEETLLLAPLESSEALSGPGSILPLAEPNGSDVFRVVAIPAGDPAVFAVDSDFSESSLREFDRIGRNKEEVVAEELFTFTESSETEATDYVLYASADGLVRFRRLKDTSGKPRGAAKTVDAGEVESLLGISVSAGTSRGYVGFSRLINRRKSAVHILPIE